MLPASSELVEWMCDSDSTRESPMPTGMAIQVCWCIDPHDKRYLAPCASTLQSGLEYFKHRNLRSWLSNISWGYVNVAIIHFFFFSAMKPCHTKESSLLRAALTEKELELTPDGRYIRWACSNPQHPRNWHPLRKAYDIGIIILLEFFTWVALFSY